MRHALRAASNRVVLLPAESCVEFQLYVQQLRPGPFVAVAAYGECARGYIPIERAWQERPKLWAVFPDPPAWLV